MSRYYAYLTNLDKSTVLTTEQWNAFVGENQATDNLLIGSMYPYARFAMSSFYVEKNNTSSFVRYYTPLATFENQNNPDITESITISYGSGVYTAHKILVPGFYAWNIVWGENNGLAGQRSDDQVIAIKVRIMTQAQVDNLNNPENGLVIGEYRTITTSWAWGSLPTRYTSAGPSTGMGFPMHNYSGIHFFNAPPYGSQYEYIVFEFISSGIVRAGNISYFSDIKHPFITLMKVR
jgi:hypothetical protein